MSASLTASPATLYAGTIATVTLAGAGAYKTRLLLDGTVAASLCYLSSGTGSGPVTLGSGSSQTITAEQMIAGSWTLVATLVVTVVAEPTTSASPHTITTNNVTIEDEVITGTLPTPGALQSLGAGISSSGGSAGSYITNLTIRRCTITGFRLGIYLQFIDGLTIEDCVIEDADYAGIAIFSCKNVTIQRNTIRRIGYVRTDFTVPAFLNNAYGIMVNRTESSSLVTDPVSHTVLIDSNSIDWVPLWMGINSHAGNGITITNNTVRHCPRGIFVAGSPTGAGTTQPVGITVDSNQIHDSVTKTGGSSDKTAITYDSWTGTSIQHNRYGSSFNNAMNTDGSSTGVTLSDNVLSGT